MAWSENPVISATSTKGKSRSWIKVWARRTRHCSTKLIAVTPVLSLNRRAKWETLSLIGSPKLSSTYTAIFINSGLVAFTATNLVNYTWPMRVWTFILMSGGIFALRGFVAFAIPDTPEWVTIQVNTTRAVHTEHLFAFVECNSSVQALICVRSRTSFLHTTLLPYRCPSRPQLTN